MVVGSKSQQRLGCGTADTVWGLSAKEMHVAFWRSRGVQVIERGREVPRQRGAELYLLTEPDQMVWFDISRVTERMSWNGATVMRLRVSMDDDQEYGERIIEDDARNVVCVQRIYRSAHPESYRVILTQRADHVASWQQAPSRRQAWMQIRRSLPYFRIDHWRCPGKRYGASLMPSRRAYVDDLVEQWTDPDRAIEGIGEIAPGVFAADHSALPSESFIIEPAWLGWTEGDSPRVVIGPRCECDEPTPGMEGREAVRIRDIDEIDPSESEGIEDQEVGTSVTSGMYAILKRSFDIIISALVMIFLSPIMLTVALAILIEDGRPVFYGHRRQTRGGPTFNCWKFRTMRRNADRLTRELQAMNQCDGPQFFIADDPRVTRVGRILRRFHLDELPQFWNVLTGDMSIVGPRPSPDEENQYCPAWREIRLSVRPGITGLWQVERTRAPGRDFQEWIRFDTEYVRSMSPWLDARILFKTAYRVLRKGLLK